MSRPIIAVVLLGLALLVPFTAFSAEILLTIPQPGSGYYSQYFGRSVVNVGDHHGDGFDDYLVGQPGWTANNGYAVGHAHFFSGGPGLYSEPQWTMIGSQWNARLGWSVTALGDFNADGQPDYAASHPGGENPGVRVFFGGPTQDGQVDIQLTTSETYSFFGGTISGGHDLNGDGHPDLVVGANHDDSGTGQNGRVYIYYGGPEVDFYPDMVLDAPLPAVGFGVNLKLVEDVTGDNQPDLLLLNWDPHLLFIYAGGPQFDDEPDFNLTLPPLGDYPNFWSPELTIPQVEAGDLDGDGPPEIVVGLPLETGGGEVWILSAGLNLDDQVDAVLTAREEGEYFGRMLNISGDYDGDGILDLLVGSRGGGEAYLSGFLYVYPGGDLQQLAPSLIMTDTAGNRRFGASAVSLGDFEGDGDDELLVGSLSPYGYIWIVDELFYDCNENDVPDLEEGAPDCDGNGVPDDCQVQWRGQDCNDNLLIDACEINQDPSLDCDGNGVLDSCQLEDNIYPDPDCDGDGVLDTCQIAADPGLDCDGDGRLDSCNILQWPDLDCNEDGLIDSCQFASDPSQDCDGDGVYDACQIFQDHLLDSDQDGVLDHCQFPGRLSLYSDPQYTSHELQTDQLGLVGPFYLVLNVPEGVSSISHVECELVLPPQLFGVQVDLNPLLGFDADIRPEGLSIFFPGVAPDADGNLEIAQVWPIVTQPGTSGVVIEIQGNFSNQGNGLFDQPVYTDYHGEDRLITTTDRGLLNGAASDVPPAEIGPRLRVANHPNPFNPRTSIQLEFPRRGSARLEILDISGRVVRQFDLQVELPGMRAVTWRGRDEQGRPVASGVYFARVRQGSLSAQTKLVLLR